MLPEINRSGQKNKKELLESNLPQEIIKNIEGHKSKNMTSEAFEVQREPMQKSNNLNNLNFKPKIKPIHQTQ